MQNATGQVNLRATIPNVGHQFWPGRFVNIRLVLSTIHGAVLVPASAPQMSANGSFIYVVKQDSTAEQRPVTLGQRQGDLIVVEKGVEPGERVVINGQLGVTPGGKVLIEQPRDAGSPATATGEWVEVMNLSEPFIRRPVMTAVLTLSVILFGVLSYFQLPVNDLPAVDYPVIQVQVGYPGASPDTIANNIATPLERQFMQINGLEVVTSQSTQGVATFTLQFALDKNIDAAATDVQTAISQAIGSLPADLPSPPTYSKSNPNDQPIMYIALTSDSVTPGQLYDYASTQVGQRISILPGVSQVNVFGTKSAIRIKANPSAMWARGISIDDLSAAIKSGTSYTGAGQLDSASGTAILRPQGQLESAEQYSNLIVGGTSSAPVYLRDIATVKDSVQDERVNMRFWVRGYAVPSATVIVAVNRRAGANAVEVSKSIHGVLPMISAELPGSIRVTPIYDRSLNIVHSVADVQMTLIIAFVLVVIVIFAFLGRVTDTLIPVVALPLSLLITFIAMRALGYSLDNLSLMALTLAIGFLVDDAIVFLENTVRRMERGEQPFRSSHQQREGNQLHDHVDDHLARGSVYAAGVYVGIGRTNLPRIRHHDCHRDPGFRFGVADAYAADVRATVKGARRGFEEDLDGARDRRHREARAGNVWRIAVVVFATPLDLARDLGCVSGRHDLVVYAGAESFPAAGRQQRHLWRVHRARRIVAEANARSAEPS